MYDQCLKAIICIVIRITCSFIILNMNESLEKTKFLQSIISEQISKCAQVRIAWHVLLQFYFTDGVLTHVYFKKVILHLIFFT
jgi:hypothetical protein